MDQLSKIGVIPNVELESPIIDHNPKLDPFWISGFISGEGSFTYFTRTRLNSKNDTRKDYTLVFEVSQDSKDSYILASIKNKFKVGAALPVYHETRGITKFRLVVKDEILGVLEPHFKDYPVLGRKALQYSTWLQIVKDASSNRT